MQTVEEIEVAIERRPSEDFCRLIEWLQKRWDARMDSDSATGKLDFLFEEPHLEHETGELRDWPRSS